MLHCSDELLPHGRQRLASSTTDAASSTTASSEPLETPTFAHGRMPPAASAAHSPRNSATHALFIAYVWHPALEKALVVNELGNRLICH